MGALEPVIARTASTRGGVWPAIGQNATMCAMPGSRTYYAYILTNKSGTLYAGVTGNLKRRVWQHKNKQVKGFTQKYNIDKLIYYETFSDVWSAIAREKQIKGWVRQRKLDLIATMNVEWHDLSEGWYD
jgi:putative endonuclease